jgi:hypothetical protein
LDVHGDRSLQKSNRDNDAILPSEPDENSFDAAKRPVFHPHFVALLQERTGFGGGAGFDNRLEGENLLVDDRNGFLGNSHDGKDAWSHHDGTSLLRVKAAKEISGEQWDINGLHAV